MQNINTNVKSKNTELKQDNQKSNVLATQSGTALFWPFNPQLCFSCEIVNRLLNVN